MSLWRALLGRPHGRHAEQWLKAACRSTQTRCDSAIVAAWVYILECADGSFYTGCTTRIDQRIAQHQSGETGGYTSARLPVKVVHVTEFQSVLDAIDAERKIKRWSRAKKQALIEGRFADLPGLSLSRWRRGSRCWASASFDTLPTRATQDDDLLGRPEVREPSRQRRRCEGAAEFLAQGRSGALGTAGAGAERS